METRALRYRAKFDRSHADITRGLKQIGWPFKDCARYPGLGFDILTKHLEGWPLMLEIKNPGPPSSRKLTDSERATLELFPDFFKVVVDLDSALEAIGLTR